MHNVCNTPIHVRSGDHRENLCKDASWACLCCLAGWDDQTVCLPMNVLCNTVFHGWGGLKGMEGVVDGWMDGCVSGGRELGLFLPSTESIQTRYCYWYRQMLAKQFYT